MRRRRLAVTGAVALTAAALVIQAVAAQQLNQRKGAPPAAESKKSRLVARAELQAREEGGSLKSDDLTVTRSCGNVQIGGPGPAPEADKPTLVGSQRTRRQEESTTIVKNVVNICR